MSWMSVSVQACDRQRLNTEKQRREKKNNAVWKPSIATEMLRSGNSLWKNKQTSSRRDVAFWRRPCFCMETVVLSDWAKEEEKPVVFGWSDLRGGNSWYSGFPRVYQAQGSALIRMRIPQSFLQPCELSEGLKKTAFRKVISQPEQAARAKFC